MYKERNYISASFLLLVFIFLGKILAFGKDVLISNFYGANWSVDAYFIANNIPGLFFAGFVSTISLVFLPMYTKLYSQSQSAANVFANNAIILYFFVALVITFIVYINSYYLVNLLAPFSSYNIKSLASNLTEILCLTFVCNTIVGFLTSIHYAHNSKVIPQLSPIVNNLLIIAFVYYASKSLGVYAIVIAAVIGWIVQVPIQGYTVTKKIVFKISFSMHDENLKKMLMYTLPTLTTVSVDQINLFVDTFLASMLDDGSISYLNYASKISNFISSIFIIVVTAIIFPYFSRLALQGDLNKIASCVKVCIKYIIVLLMPFLVVSFIFSKEVVSIIYGRGAFDSVAIEKTSNVFYCYSFGMAFVVIKDVFNKALYSCQYILVPLIVSVFSIILNFIVSFFLMELYGIEGLAIGSVLSTIFACCFILIIALKRVSFFSLNDFKYGVKVFLSSCLLFFILLFLRGVLDSYGLILMVFVIPFCVFIYFLFLYLFKVKEINVILDYVKSFMLKY